MDKKHMGKRVAFIVIPIIVLALLAGGVWWLFNSGHLMYVNSTSSQSVPVACGTDIVDKYNAAMYFTVRSGSTQPSIDDQGIKDLVTKIKSKSSYQTDPTCQTIIFWSAVRGDDYKAASSAYDVIISLHKKRIFADSNLRSDQPLFMYAETLKGLTGSGFSNGGSFGG